MKLSIGIVGLPNVGKSTLFKILTAQNITVANYPFATIDPNVGVVPVPDERIEKLAALSQSKKKIPAVVEFYDIAGLVKGANKGEGLGNQFLSHIRECAAIVHLVRCFQSGEIIHVEGAPNPIRDIDIITTELILKDLDTVEKRFHKAESDARSGKKEFIVIRDALKHIKETLDAGEPLFMREDILKMYKEIIFEMGLLTAKKQILLLNGSEDDATPEVREKAKSLHAEFVVADLGLGNPVPTLIQKAYDMLNLMSFLTTGEDETRAWTIERGIKAPQAAGVIHTDFEDKFIRAEVVNWQKLLEAGGWVHAKQKGWLRIEGKEYVVQDGDVMVIRHS